MVKIGQVTKEQFKQILQADDKVEKFKEFIDIENNHIYGIGDTAIGVNNAKTFEVYKDTFCDMVIYYIIANVLGPNMAFALSIYSKV